MDRGGVHLTGSNRYEFFSETLRVGDGSEVIPSKQAFEACLFVYLKLILFGRSRGAVSTGAAHLDTVKTGREITGR